MNRSSFFFLVGSLIALAIFAGPLLNAQSGLPRVLTYLDTFKGTEEIELRWPVAVAAASEDEVAIADTHGPRLFLFRKIGVSWQLDKAVPMPGVPVDLGWDGSRYVASLRQGGGLVAFAGSELTQRQLPLPRDVVPGPLAVLPNGDLLLYDYAGRRAVWLSETGELVREAAITGGVTALVASPAGGFLAAVAAEGSIQQFDANGKLRSTWDLPASNKTPPWPVGLAVEPGGDVIVVDRHAGRLLVIDAAGRVVGLGSRRGWEPGLLLYPAGVARLPNGPLLVADEGNGRAQLFRRTD